LVVAEKSFVFAHLSRGSVLYIRERREKRERGRRRGRERSRETTDGHR
jgi:hypothetical protein